MALPELPGARRGRLGSDYGLPRGEAVRIAADRDLADLFEGAVAAGADAKHVANWIIGEVAPTGKIPTAEHLADLVKLVTSGGITRDQGREVLMESVETGRAPSDILTEHGFAQVSDEASLLAVVEAVMEANPRAVEDYRPGTRQAISSLRARQTH